MAGRRGPGSVVEPSAATCSQRAADWLLSNMYDLDGAVERALEPKQVEATTRKALDGKGRYELLGFVSHMGSNTACGHYVCHVRKEVPGLEGPRWVIFNDEKVALSENPPRGLGYLYLFRRVDG